MEFFSLEEIRFSFFSIIVLDIPSACNLALLSISVILNSRSSVDLVASFNFFSAIVKLSKDRLIFRFISSILLSNPPIINFLNGFIITMTNIIKLTKSQNLGSSNK